MSARPSLCGWPSPNGCPGQSEAAMSVGKGTEEHDQGRRACLSSLGGPEQKGRQRGVALGLREESQKACLLLLGDGQL